MTDPSTCPACGAPLAEGSAGGMCPACLLHAAMGGDSTLHLGEMPQITSLELYGSDLSDLSGAAGLRNLEALLLATPQISDLHPLTALPKLKSLCIMNSPVAELAPLAGLVELRDLQFWMCLGIASVEPLSKLPNLMSVDIEGYYQVDLSLDLSPLLAMERRGGEVFLDSFSKRLKRSNP